MFFLNRSAVKSPEDKGLGLNDENKLLFFFQWFVHFVYNVFLEDFVVNLLKSQSSRPVL